MIRLAISVEGETEEAFVKHVLHDHLYEHGVYAIPILIGRARNRRSGGGNVTIDELAKEMRELQGNHAAVTSLVDFYGFKGKGDRSPEQLIEAIKNRVRSDSRFVIPYVQLHEFEGLLFSNVEVFQQEFDAAPMNELRVIRAEFNTPEDINDNKETAPSKRLKRLMPDYEKVVAGPSLAARIGIDRIRTECPGFNAWLRRLESLNA